MKKIDEILKSFNKADKKKELKEKINEKVNEFSKTFTKIDKKKKEAKEKKKGKGNEKAEERKTEAGKLVESITEVDDLFLGQVFGLSATPYDKGGCIITKAMETKAEKANEQGWHQRVLLLVSGAMPVVDDLELTDATKLAVALMMMADTLADMMNHKMNGSERNEMRKREAVRAMGIKCCLRAFVKDRNGREGEIGNGDVFVLDGLMSVENDGHNWNLCVHGKPVSKVNLGSPESFDQAAAHVPMDVMLDPRWDDIEVPQLREPTEPLKEKARKIAGEVSDDEQENIKNSLEEVFKKKEKGEEKKAEGAKEKKKGKEKQKEKPQENAKG